MNSEKQYIELYEQARQIIFDHAPEAMNAVRDKAFEDFKRLGFPSRKVERYKYTSMGELFAPDYGLNLNRLKFPVNPYDVFRCDVPNLSTQLFFMVNDAFYQGAQGGLPQGEKDGVQVCSLSTITSSLLPITSYPLPTSSSHATWNNIAYPVASLLSPDREPCV